VTTRNNLKKQNLNVHVIPF